MTATGTLPSKIGTYDIRRMLATGTMGDVYQGSTIDPRTKTPVYFAIKVLNPKSAKRHDYLARFKSEIKDDHLIEYKEIEYDSKFQYYFVSDYLEVKPVSRGSLKRERSPEILDVFAKVCASLDKAHKKGYIHGNIKTSNFLIRRAEEGVAQPILSDYGLCYVYDKDYFTGDRFESAFAYMSPEKIDELLAGVEPKASKLNAAADTYSLACVLVEALSGMRPFAGPRTPDEMKDAKRDRKYFLLHVNHPVCRVDIRRLNETIKRALSYDAGARYASAAEFGAALTACKVGGDVKK